MGVAHDVGPALARELAELDEGDAAVAGEGGVAETGGIEQEAAGGIVAVLVGEHAFQHQDLLALRMAVRMEGRVGVVAHDRGDAARSEEHTSELQSLMRISYAVFCLKKKNKKTSTKNSSTTTFNID